jgi:hypothetical protein
MKTRLLFGGRTQFPAPNLLLQESNGHWSADLSAHKNF